MNEGGDVRGGEGEEGLDMAVADAGVGEEGVLGHSTSV